MRPTLLLILIVAINYSTFSQNYNWNTPEIIGPQNTSLSPNEPVSIISTKDGIFVFGTVLETVAIGDTVLYNEGDERYPEHYVVKYDKAGNFVWVKTEGLRTRTLSVVKDKDDFIYVTGSIRNDQTIGNTFIEFDNGGLYVAKFNSDWELVQIKQIPAWFNRAYSSAIDTAGNYYLSFSTIIILAGMIFQS